MYIILHVISNHLIFQIFFFENTTIPTRKLRSLSINHNPHKYTTYKKFPLNLFHTNTTTLYFNEQESTKLFKNEMSLFYSNII